MTSVLLNPFWFIGTVGSGLTLPGTAGNYLSSPDSVLNSVKGDIDIRVCAKLDDWTPALADTALISKYNAAGNQKAWLLTMGAGGTGRPRFYVSHDGLATTSLPTSTTAVPFADGTVGWIRVTVDVDNGAGQYATTFYTSLDGVTWTLLHGPVNATGVFNFFDSTAPIELGSFSGGTGGNLAGTIYYAEVRNGIDGPVVSKFDASTVQSSGAQVPAAVNGWTVNGSALYRRDDYMRLPGTAGNYLSWPDTAAVSVTGDLDLRAKVSLDDWTPAGVQNLVAKRTTSGGNLRSYRLGISATSALRLSLSADGTAESTVTSTSLPTVADGAVLWVRGTWRQSDGRVQFFTSSDGTTWTQLGIDQTIAIASINDNAAPLEIGSINSGAAELLAGNVYAAEVRSGIDGTVVASFDARNITTPWTVNGAGWSWEGASFAGKPTTALSLPGTSGNYVTSPDSAGNSLVGDMDLRAKVTLADWTPAADTAFLVKDNGDPNRSYRFSLSTTGALVLAWFPTGSAASQITKTSTVTLGLADGATKWVRATLDVDNGATGNDVKFYTSDDGMTWTQLGTTLTTAGVTLMVDTNASQFIGARAGGTADLITGTVYYAEVRNGIEGPIVARFDPTAIARTGVRTPVTTVQPGGTPNLLTPQQASLEDGTTTGWAVGSNATIANSAAQALDGTKSLAMTAVAIGVSFAATTSSSGTVVAGKLYTATANMRAATVGRAIQINIDWYSAGPTYLSTTSALASSADVTTGWTAISGSAVAPATAVFGAVKLKVNDAAQVATEVHYVDRVSLVETPATWTLNGSAWDLVQVTA